MKSFLFLMIVLTVFPVAQSQTKNGFDLGNSSIPIGDIKSGGPPKDGIPAIDDPKFLSSSKASLSNNDRILGVYENGIAKAYPIAIMNYHEIVNDDFEEKAVVITYCPLCGSGIAFNAKVNDKILNFGVSGLLYNSDVLLYDRQTESLWSQLKYQAITGQLKGEQLTVLNTANTTWESWKDKHPNTLVLSEDTGFNRNYSRNPYPNYEESSQLYFPVNNINDLFPPKEMVIGLEINGRTKAYPFSELKKLKGKILEDTFAGQTLKIKYNTQAKSAEIMDAQDNHLPAITNFWFAWYAFNPDTEVYQHTR
ncbi:DUF3179 domain-containing protein [Salegentibacter sp. JZCK2]|uniref:DUF3179 domain-containing protein n=1 Tax=Salegentibacter tibetensis TaxID=2873600 RepID=UPI001CCBBD73|nr:DUF3179 domain-containing protein [Salegentibacter tibetensis]MBZ9731525.1 DUF3179 domain-containing protein [Salegentibacter tibetensis]